MRELLPKAPADMVHSLDSWSMSRSDNGQDFVLTLRTPEGQAFSFAVKSWHVEGMATIATHASAGRPSQATLH